MSNNERPEGQAFQELEGLVRRLGDELAGARRRAQLAESRLGELAPPDDQARSRARIERVAELERETATLRRRLDAATARTRSMLDRVHFLRQQVQGGGR